MSTIITRAEVEKHRHRDNLWMIIDDQVYDVAKYVEEHPGGEDPMLDNAGTDATKAFIGHSEDARKLLEQYKIGELPDDEKTKNAPVCCDRKPPKRNRPCTKSCTPLDRKGSCSDCTSASSCLAASRQPVKKSTKNWRNFDEPDGGSALTSKGSKSTRFVVPPDKCDELPTSTAAPSKVVINKDDSLQPKTKKKKKGNWKWYALAALIIGAIAVGAVVVKKNA